MSFYVVFIMFTMTVYRKQHMHEQTAEMLYTQVVDHAYKKGKFSCQWTDINSEMTEQDSDCDEVDHSQLSMELCACVMDQNKASKRSLLEKTYSACSKVCWVCCVLLCMLHVLM